MQAFESLLRCSTSDSGPAEPVQIESMRDSSSDNKEHPELQNKVESWEFSKTSSRHI